MPQQTIIFKSHYDNARLEEVLDIFERALVNSPYPVEFSRPYWAEFIQRAWDNPQETIIILAEDVDNNLVGVLVGSVYHGHPLTKFWKVSMESFWYVDPEHRGKGSIQMMKLYEDWSKEVGCTHLTMSLLANEYKDKLDRIYKARGYAPLETQYIRSLSNED